jgi:hypothetical protein
MENVRKFLQAKDRPASVVTGTDVLAGLFPSPLFLSTTIQQPSSSLPTMTYQRVCTQAFLPRTRVYNTSPSAVHTWKDFHPGAVPESFVCRRPIRYQDYNPLRLSLIPTSSIQKGAETWII